jgi:hypothetical protein
MNSEHQGSFRTRIAGDGSLEVWARGWRLESQLYALVPMGLALMFPLAPMSLPMIAVGAVVMLAATFLVFRMTKPGLWLTDETVSIVSIVRTQRFEWNEVSGFMGERGHDEARLLLVLEDERRIPLPGTLDPAELDPYGDEGQELSAADQLNQLKERAVARDLPRSPVPAIPAPGSLPDRVRDGVSDPPTRKERRTERKALRAALKAVRLVPEGGVVSEASPEEESIPSRRRGGRPRREPVAELMEVTVGEAEPVSVAAPVASEDDRPGLPSHFPAPVYIPQAEYAQMLRDQKAAEKAALEAAAELRRLAHLEGADEPAKKEEFSDWIS